jgi:tRNA pseudouridine55 synthase
VAEPQPVLMASGLLVVDKPKGPTSHDVVDRVRRVLGVKRVGHTGTLDPLATGVLAVCVGKATRLVRFLSGGEKVYTATVRLGFDTTTDDLLGDPLGERAAVEVGAAAVEAALQRLMGDIVQTAPAFSAKRVGGRRLYDLARRGVPADAPTTRVSVYALDLLAHRGDEVDLLVRCSPGTYVRALARDLGALLGTGGHLTALRRLRSGEFTLDQALTWEALAPGVSLIPMSAVLQEVPSAVVSAEGREALRHGRALDRGLVTEGFPESAVERVRLLDEGGSLLALAVPRGFTPHPPPLQSAPLLHPEIVLIE